MPALEALSVVVCNLFDKTYDLQLLDIDYQRDLTGVPRKETKEKNEHDRSPAVVIFQCLKRHI